MPKPGFRQFVPKMGTALHYQRTQQTFAETFPESRVEKRRTSLERIMAEPFKGIATGGHITPGLFETRDEGAPTGAILAAAAALLACLTPTQKRELLLPLDSKERHTWQNSIAHYETYGLRFENVSQAVRDAALGVLRASLSATGYDRSRKLMQLNAFLGELVGATVLMNEFCYQLHFFGEPSATEPWGWQWSGHHLCLTCFITGTQMTLTPAFMGAEPRYIDSGPHAGVSVFDDEERDGLAFARNLSAAQKRKAIVYDTTLPEGLPPGRHQGFDGMALGGAYADNLIVPLEGITGAELDPRQRRALLDLTQCYLSPLPAGPLAARMGDVERHIAETHFSWAGGLADDSAFYYRIQSPVVMIEFDHHAGIVLTNETPEKFHIHTIVRTPNGNDYGMDLLRQHYETAPHHRHGHDHHHD